MKIDFIMKRLGNMLNDDFYDLPGRYAPQMQDMGYVEFVRECHRYFGANFCISHYRVTDAGKKAYEKWLEEKNERQVPVLNG